MGKNQSASGLTNVIQYSNGNITFVSGSTTLMSISSSGAITTTGVISGSNALSASYAANADTLDGLDSTVFTLTSSFNAFSSSILAQTASLNLFSASVLSYTSSANNRFSSIETVTGSNITRLGALEAATGSLYSYTSSLNLKTASFATTGSNTFIGTQTISGSVLQSGSFTTTGTIIAQTINVQTVTSSIVYSSGSNIFGNLLGDSQTFTGSVLVTGSLTIAAGGNASAPIIFGSTIACSPIGCFATSCATSFIGGTMSGTTIYGSTAVCSPVGKFTTCIDACAGYFSGVLQVRNTSSTPSIWSGQFGGAISILGDNSTSNRYIDLSIVDSTGVLATQGLRLVNSGTVVIGSTSALNSEKFGVLMSSNCSVSTVKAVARFSNDGSGYIPKIILTDNNIADATISFIPAGAGTSTLSFGIQGVCVGYQYLNIKENGNVGIGTSTPVGKLDVTLVNTRRFIVTYDDSIITIKGASDTGAGENLRMIGDNLIFNTNSVGSGTERMRITSTGIACFACQICAKSLYFSSNATGQITFGSNDACNPYIVSDSSNILYLGNNNSYKILIPQDGSDMVFRTSPTYANPQTRLTITAAGIACFACEVCAPNFVASSGMCVTSNTFTKAGPNSAIVTLSKTTTSGCTCVFNMGVNGYSPGIGDNVSGLVIVTVNQTNSNIQLNSGTYIGVVNNPRGANACLIEISRNLGNSNLALRVVQGTGNNDIEVCACSASGITTPLRYTLTFIGGGGLS